MPGELLCVMQGEGGLTAMLHASSLGRILEPTQPHETCSCQRLWTLVVMMQQPLGRTGGGV